MATEPTTTQSSTADTTLIPSSTQSTQTITIGTRRSHLARLQTSQIHSLLQSAHPNYTYRIHAMDPLGDRDKSTALYAFNSAMGKSLWTSELEGLLEAGELDLIVHSLKDMPTTLPKGLILGAVVGREEARDAIVLRRMPGEEINGIIAKERGGEGNGKRSADDILRSLPEGSIIGTSSLRRTAQLKRRYTHLVFRDVRGNVPTRLRKLDHAERPDGFRDADDQKTDGKDAAQVETKYAALILAAAGLLRLGLGERIDAYLSSEDGGMLHAVGQGALGVEIREGDGRVEGLLRGLSDEKGFMACLAERAVMRTLEGGCSVPIGVETEWTASGEGSNSKEELRMKAVVVSLDGAEAVEADERKVVENREEAEEFGKYVAKMLIQRGAGKILEEINKVRHVIAPERVGD